MRFWLILIIFTINCVTVNNLIHLFLLEATFHLSNNVHVGPAASAVSLFTDQDLLLFNLLMIELSRHYLLNSDVVCSHLAHSYKSATLIWWQMNISTVALSALLKGAAGMIKRTEGHPKLSHWSRDKAQWQWKTTNVGFFCSRKKILLTANLCRDITWSGPFIQQLVVRACAGILYTGGLSSGRVLL